MSIVSFPLLRLNIQMPEDCLWCFRSCSPIKVVVNGNMSGDVSIDQSDIMYAKDRRAAVQILHETISEQLEHNLFKIQYFYEACGVDLSAMAARRITLKDRDLEKIITFNYYYHDQIPMLHQRIRRAAALFQNVGIASNSACNKAVNDTTALAIFRRSIVNRGQLRAEESKALIENFSNFKVLSEISAKSLEALSSWEVYQLFNAARKAYESLEVRAAVRAELPRAREPVADEKPRVAIEAKKKVERHTTDDIAKELSEAMAAGNIQIGTGNIGEGASSREVNPPDLPAPAPAAAQSTYNTISWSQDKFETTEGNISSQELNDLNLQLVRLAKIQLQISTKITGLHVSNVCGHTKAWIESGDGKMYEVRLNPELDSELLALVEKVYKYTH